MAVSVFIVCLLVFRGYVRLGRSFHLVSGFLEFTMEALAIGSKYCLRSQLFRHAQLRCCKSVADLLMLGSKSLPKFPDSIVVSTMFQPCFYFPSLGGMICQWAYWMAQPPTGWLLIKCCSFPFQWAKVAKIPIFWVETCWNVLKPPETGQNSRRNCSSTSAKRWPAPLRSLSRQKSLHMAMALGCFGYQSANWLIL